jgi:hypothetical protein
MTEKHIVYEYSVGVMDLSGSRVSQDIYGVWVTEEITYTQNDEGVYWEEWNQ